MKKIVLVVEGDGDVQSMPSLVAKTVNRLGLSVIPCEQPIRSGEARKLRRPGELERFLRLAASREEASEILVVLDLDDGCAAAWHEEFRQRADPISQASGKRIGICFCVREFEGWILASLDSVRQGYPEIGIEEAIFVENHEDIRGAKERLREICGRHGYKETRDQVKMTKKLDLNRLYECSRSFRKFVKELSGLSYEEIDIHFSGCVTRTSS